MARDQASHPRLAKGKENLELHVLVPRAGPASNSGCLSTTRKAQERKPENEVGPGASRN